MSKPKGGGRKDTFAKTPLLASAYFADAFLFFLAGRLFFSEYPVACYEGSEH